MSSLKEMTLEIDQLLNKAKEVKEANITNQIDDSPAHKISARDCFTPTDMQLSAMEKIKKFLTNNKGIEGKEPATKKIPVTKIPEEQPVDH